MMNTFKQPDFSFKIVLIGDSGVGKSNIISRFTKDQFTIQSKTTIGVQFATKTLEINENSVRLQVWDTAGQQRYRSMASAYYRGASGAMLVYDITKAYTFENIQKWIKQLKSYGPENLVCLLIGNKSDLENERALKKQEGQQCAKQNKMGFLETSALQKLNIDQAFNQMVQQIMLRNKTKPVSKQKQLGMKRQPYLMDQQKKKQKKCCN